MIKDEWREGHIGNLDEYIAFKWEAIQTARLHTPPTKEDIDEFISAYSDSGDDYDHEKGGRALVFYSDALYDSDTLIIPSSRRCAGMSTTPLIWTRSTSSLIYSAMMRFTNRAVSYQ
jgi:hypothetical protein